VPPAWSLGRRTREDLVDQSSMRDISHARQWVPAVTCELSRDSSRVRDSTCKQLEEQTAQRIDVGASGDRVTVDLLRSCIVQRPQPMTGVRQPALRRGLARKAEVREVAVLVLTGSREQDVGRFDVAMHKPGGVGSI
jgi:hypothetical protein